MLKYEKTNHIVKQYICILFGSKYQFVHIDRNEYLVYLSRYLHRNPIEVDDRTPLDQYTWSSYIDYLGPSRWGGMLSQHIITDQFRNAKEYRNYVESYGGRPINGGYLIDD